jgi:putative Holliday junction resolvase
LRGRQPVSDRAGRVLALDLGNRRIGVASSDAGRILASPYGVIERAGTHEADHRRIAAVVEELDAALVVVGLPLSLDGSDGPAATAVRAELAELGNVLPVPVEPWDERLSTVSAARGLRARGVKAKAARKVIDQEAAAVILQGWLDAHG